MLNQKRKMNIVMSLTQSCVFWGCGQKRRRIQLVKAKSWEEINFNKKYGGTSQC